MTYYPSFLPTPLRSCLPIFSLSVAFIALFPPAPGRAAATREGRNARRFIHPLEVSRISIDKDHAGEGVCPLEPGVLVRGEIAGAKRPADKIAFSRGLIVHVGVGQPGLDPTARLFGPDGQKLSNINSRNGAQGPAHVPVLAGSMENDGGSGVEETQTGTSQDERRVAAERAFAEGEQLRAQDTAESLPKAIRKYEEALSLWRAAGDRSGEANTLINLGQVYRKLSKEKEAVGYFEEGLSASRAAGDRQLEATALNSVGQSHGMAGRFAQALDYHRQALAIYRALNDRMQEAVTINTIGEVHFFLGEYHLALAHFTQAQPILHELGDRRAEELVLNNLGVVYDNLNEPQLALQYYSQALDIQRAEGMQRAMAASLNNIGVAYARLGDRQKAVEYHHQALPLRRAVGDKRGEAVSLNNLGVNYGFLGDHQIALGYFNQTLPLRRETNDRAGEASTLNNLGFVYHQLGDKQRAQQHYQQALEIRQQIGDRSGEASTLQNLGFLSERSGDAQTAHNYYTQALLLRRKVGNRRDEAQTLSELARLERGLNRLDEAREKLETALDIVESLRSKVASQELRISYLSSWQNYYELYISVLMQQHRLDPSKGLDAMALRASERASARGLLDLLMDARVDIRQGVDPALLELERSLQQQLNAKEAQRMRLLNRKITGAQLEAVEGELSALLTRYQEVRGRIRASSPRYADLTQPSPLALIEIQRQVLDDDSLLLEYSLGEEQSFLWAVTPTSMRSFELPKRAEVEALARRVYELLTARSRRPEGETAEQRRARLARAEAEYGEAAADLSRMVLGPAAALLGTKRLLIVSDGALQYIPFAALPVPPTLRQAGARRKADAFKPLIAEHEVVSLPSASALAALRQELARRKPAPKFLAVMADPVFSGSDIRLSRKVSGGDGAAGLVDASAKTNGAPADAERAAEELGLSGFTRLPFSRQEADAVVALVPEKSRMLLLDFAASREAAQDAGLADYRLLHLATHGLLNSRRPELSGLVFSLVDEQGRPRDGFLRLHEIYNLKLAADLVVLSACQTALGKEVRGEGLVGLTRGFMYAGAPRVVASLWRVDDRATAQLMRRFYHGMLIEGLKPPAALRAAQVSLWKEERWRSPYNWAAFVMQGEWR